MALVNIVTSLILTSLIHKCPFNIIIGRLSQDSWHVLRIQFRWMCQPHNNMELIRHGRFRAYFVRIELSLSLYMPHHLILIETTKRNE